MSTCHTKACLYQLAVQLDEITRILVDEHRTTATETGNELLPCSIFDCLSSIQRESHQQCETSSSYSLVRIFTMMTTTLKDDNKNAILCFQFFVKLIIKAANSNNPTLLMLRGFSRMAKRVTECITSGTSPVSLRFRWSSHQDVLAIIQSRLASHQVTHWQGTFSVSTNIQDFILSLFIATMQEKCGDELRRDTHTDSSVVTFHTIVGPVENVRMLNATLLMDIPLTREMRVLLEHKRSRGLIVALFECSLELSSGGDKQTVELSHQPVGHGQTSAEHIMLSQFAQMLVSSHVQVVCCQKRVHPYLVRRLKELDIVCISRVSVKYMGALVRLTGARQLTTMPIVNLQEEVCCTCGMDPSSLGYVHKIEYVHVYGKPFLVAQGYHSEDGSLSEDPDNVELTCGSTPLRDYLLQQYSHLPRSFTTPYAENVARRQRNCVTVVVAAPTEITVTLWQRAVEDVLGYLRRLSSERAAVLPGRGIWMAILARELRTTLKGSVPQDEAARPISRVARQTLAAERLFVDCLEECAVAAGGARTQRRQVSPDGDGWDQEQLLAQFALIDESEGTLPTLRRVLRSPDGDEVTIIQEPRGHTRDAQISPHWTYRLDTTGTHAAPPLDSLSGSLSALQIATEAACALLDVDGICNIEARSV